MPANILKAKRKTNWYIPGLSHKESYRQVWTELVPPPSSRICVTREKPEPLSFVIIHNEFTCSGFLVICMVDYNKLEIRWEPEKKASSL